MMPVEPKEVSMSRLFCPRFSESIVKPNRRKMTRRQQSRKNDLKSEKVSSYRRHLSHNADVLSL